MFHKTLISYWELVKPEPFTQLPSLKHMNQNTYTILRSKFVVSLIHWYNTLSLKNILSFLFNQLTSNFNVMIELKVKIEFKFFIIAISIWFPFHLIPISKLHLSNSDFLLALKLLKYFFENVFFSSAFFFWE